MASTLQVILQSDVDKLGKSGDLVKVKPGYARNYLLPRSLAVRATSAHINRLTHDKAVALARAEKTKKEALGIAETIGKLHLKLARPVGEDGRLFGSVTTKEIETAAKAEGVTIDRKKMQLSEPLKAIGIVEIPVKLMTDVVATLKVEVVAK